MPPQRITHAWKIGHEHQGQQRIIKSFGIGIESRFFVQSAPPKTGSSFSCFVFFGPIILYGFPPLFRGTVYLVVVAQLTKALASSRKLFCHQIDSLASRREASDGHKGMTVSQYVCSSRNEMSSSLKQYGKRKGPDFVSGPFRLNDWRNLLEL